MQLPLSPASFTVESVPTAAELNQIAGLTSFATQVPIVVSLKKNATQAASAGTSTPVTWQTVEVDSDGMHSTGSPSLLTAQTQGYFKFHATIAATISTAADYLIQVIVTTGAHNPSGSGIQTLIYQSSGRSTTATGDNVSLHVAGLTPPMYVGDNLQVVFMCTATVSINNSFLKTGNTDIAGNTDGASCIEMYWICEGP